jgi:hypothetical protein
MIDHRAIQKDSLVQNGTSRSDERHCSLQGHPQQPAVAAERLRASGARRRSRLSTGRKVNSALDDPLNYFQSAVAERPRGKDLNRLLDNMGLGIETIEAADNGLVGDDAAGRADAGGPAQLR